ncbi:MAG TPA: YCF48-related protein [Acidobacteriaceae bacterium]|nr:YCF48-related protein [Acidobacteriaceae bacterium]
MMATGGTNDSYTYLGLAGETGRGRKVQSGLYRMADGGGEWEVVRNGLPDAPAVRALAVHPVHSEIVYAGTQHGPYRSEDRGLHWEKIGVPDHGLPVWSLLFHPTDPKVIFVGYENCEIYRSNDAGARWTRLPVSVRFPEITTAPGSNPAKRVLMLDASASDPDLLYAAIEVGGILRSRDGGEHWECLSHGQYLNDDAVDMHGVLASRWRPGTVFGIGRAGMFRSVDGGDHWRHVALDPLNQKGQIYCRDIHEVPGSPRKLWVAAGANFESDLGVLLYSADGGDSWTRVDMGVQPPHTMFKLAFDERQPSRMSCATNGGEVYSSLDSGETWQACPPPPGGTQIYALARG